VATSPDKAVILDSVLEIAASIVMLALPVLFISVPNNTTIGPVSPLTEVIVPPPTADCKNTFRALTVAV